MVAIITKLENNNSSKFQLNSKEFAYYRYTIENDPESSIFSITANKTSDKVGIYVSIDELYPDEKNCLWTSAKKDPLAVLWNYLDPFSEDIKGIIKWPPEKDLLDTRIKIDGFHWKHRNKVCYISLCNLSKEPIEGEITIREEKDVDLLAHFIKNNCMNFIDTFKDVKGDVISYEERKNANGKKFIDKQYAYGEIELISFIALLTKMTLKKDGVFWDLGCGVGKALIASAIAFNDFKAICGVEIIPGLYDAAKNIIADYCEKSSLFGDKFILHNDDILNVDWTDANILFASSMCFSDEFMERLGKKGKQLKPGTVIISTKKWIPREDYVIMDFIQIRMSWGMTGVYIMRKT